MVILVPLAANVVVVDTGGGRTVTATLRWDERNNVVAA